jgi:hypothetical protein
MTIRELIKELQKYPKDTKVATDDGDGWVAFDVYLEYDKSLKQIGIYAHGHDYGNTDN